MKRKLFQNINKLDIILLGCIITVCYISFMHADVTHTAGASFGYLNGHILDFYDYCAEYLGGLAYMPTTYIIYAIWNIPMRILGVMTIPTMVTPVIARMWYKLMTTLFYAASTILMKRIGVKLFKDEKTATFAALLFASSPIAIFSQFCFSQYDIITCFLVLLGINYWLNDNRKGFVVSFAIAVTCKYFALLLFVPLLLLKEKKIVYIVRDVIGVVSIFVLETLIYAGSFEFRDGVFGFSAVSYASSFSFNNGHNNIGVMMVVWALLCAYAYYLEDVNEEKYMIYLLNCGAFCSFGLSFWHPQWLLLGVPFWSLAICSNKHRDALILVDTVFALVYFIFISFMWQEGANVSLFELGIFARVVKGTNIGYILNHELLGLSATNADTFATVLFGLMLIYMVFSHPKYQKDNYNEELKIDVRLNRLRYLAGLGSFLIPTFICVYMGYQAPVAAYEVDTSNKTVSAPIATGEELTLKFTGYQGEIEGFNIRFGTYAYPAPTNYAYTLVDDKTGNVVVSGEINGHSIKDNRYTYVAFDETVQMNGGTYTLNMETLEGNYISIYLISDYENAESYRNGELIEKEYDIVLMKERQ